MTLARSAVLAASLVAVAAALAGCSSEMQAPLDALPSNATSTPTSAVSRYMACALPATQASAKIGPQGGTLMLGKSRLTVPAGALPAPVKISAKASTAGVAAVELQPAGLQFAVPATLSIDYAGCPQLGDVVKKIVYVDDAWRVVEVLASQDVRAATHVDAAISHFSKYAIAY
jgi:hypothetical protein